MTGPDSSSHDLPSRVSATRCECRCGYTCGGPGKCPIAFSSECLNEHFVVDCDHKWDGPWKDLDERSASVTCSKCGAVQMYHDMWVGP